MCKVRLNVEPKFITEDSEVRLYLSILPIWKREPRKNYKNKKVLQIFYRILIASAVTLPIAMVSIQLAYLERGYWAIGGEYLLIFLVFWFYFKQAKYFIKYKKMTSIRRVGRS